MEPKFITLLVNNPIISCLDCAFNMWNSHAIMADFPHLLPYPKVSLVIK
jgi:hypothetical protein